MVLGYFASLLFNKYFNYNSISNLTLRYLRTIKDIDYNRNQSKKVWPTIFSLKGQFVSCKNSVGHIWYLFQICFFNARFYFETCSEFFIRCVHITVLPLDGLKHPNIGYLKTVSLNKSNFMKVTEAHSEHCQTFNLDRLQK